MILGLTWHNDCLGCDVSIVLGCKWKRRRREFLHSHECVEGKNLCASQGG